MPNETLARRYATAIFQLASEAGAVERVRTDLHGFVAALRADDAVRRFFVAPIVDRDEKAALIAQSFSGLSEIALHSILLLIRKHREGLIEEIVGSTTGSNAKLAARKRCASRRHASWLPPSSTPWWRS